ncbi:unnamed protein product [Somion occarium]
MLLPKLLQAARNKDAFDDRSRLFNEALYFLSRLPQESKISKQLNEIVIGALYNTVPHPPAAFIGTNSNGTSPLWQNISPPSAEDAQSLRSLYASRSADGSGNSPLTPGLGQAGTPYARSVQNKHPLPPHLFPDTGLVFDALLKARDFKPHPGGNSSLTFAYASLVTHQLFRTDPRDMSKNNTSSYLDLSVLYGINQQQQDLVRDKEHGRGLLYPDAFAEDRLVLVPPAASALLVMFSRNHNYIADMLLKINERGRWTNPPPEDPTKRAVQDEEIFQTARLVNCGHYMSTIFGDYVAGFLGTGREGNSWVLQPFDPIKTSQGVVERGEGNHCSVEFNLLYRWHATTAKEDIKWTEDLFKRTFGDKPASQLTLEDFGPGVTKVWSTEVDPNPRTRTFAGLKRGSDGKFSDDDLARVLQDATDKPAGAYRARGTPEVLRLIEIMGMEQARKWGVCSMNEFRKFLGLKPFANFKEWNSDEVIARTAEQLYGHIDNLELYPGLQAEEIIPLGRGSGLCCGYTMTRAILGDAIALVRGDRFYTTDYTPTNLTAWGYQDCARDPNNGAFGAALPKLLLRHLPRHYTSNSVYGLFPFFTPETSHQTLTKLKVVEKYTFKRTLPQPIPKTVNTMVGLRHVFSKPDIYKTTYGEDMRNLTNGFGFMLVFDDGAKHNWYRKEVIRALFPDHDTCNGYVAWYKAKTQELLQEYSYKIDGVPGTRVDIVRNVINLVAVHWASGWLVGAPLKTRQHPIGLFTEQEMYDVLMLLCTCVFINVLPEHGFFLRSQAKVIGDKINGLIESSIEAAAPQTTTRLSHFVNKITSYIWAEEEKLCYPFLRRLAAIGIERKEMVSQVIGLAVGSSVNYAQSIAQVVDFYLDDERAAERAEIVKLVKRNNPEATELIHGYIREGQRLAPQFPGLLRVAVKPDQVPLGAGLPPLAVQPGDIIFSSYFNAQRNPTDFPDPLKVNPRRPKDVYQNQGSGFHVCPGVDFTLMTATEIMKIIFSLPNLRRAPGAAGRMASFMTQQIAGTDNRMYLDNTSKETPWPGSLTVVYDA